jgi:hypothetical protein
MKILLICPQCGYDKDVDKRRLEGITTIRCPKCGANFPAEPDGSARPQTKLPRKPQRPTKQKKTEGGCTQVFSAIILIPILIFVAYIIATALGIL